MFTFSFSTIRNEDYLCLNVMFALNDNASFRITQINRIHCTSLAKISILMFSFAGEERIYIHITKITALVVYQELVVVASPVVWVQAVQERTIQLYTIN